MKLGHYVVIQQTRRRIPGRNVCRLAYRSSLDRQIDELLKKAEGARLVKVAGGNTTYYVTDDLYREIYDRTFNDAGAGDNVVGNQDKKR